ncbi:MAG: FAD-dependent oxidoreductase [Archangium sp.]|nr:FAD-dependent oxidoreductase [Archangium sp.]
MGDNSPPSGPDFTRGIDATELKSVLLGQAQGESVLLVRVGHLVHAIGAKCSHYGSQLSDGAVQGTTIRCPWHHACFDLRSGEAVEGPALQNIPVWEVKQAGGRITVLGKKPATPAAPQVSAGAPSSIVIIGAGAGGESAAEELRRRGYPGPVTLIDADADSPIDRPNLSKDNLAGTAPEDWLWLHPAEWYAEQRIERVVARVTKLDRAGKRLTLADGTTREYGALILATGASAITPQLSGQGPAVFPLRTTSDMRAIVKALEGKKRAVVIGGSFIGLEVAAALRTRGLEVQVVSPEGAPLARVVGPEVAAVVKRLHEEKGVRFHLGRRATALDAKGVLLDDGTLVEGELVVAGVGVRPNLSLAEDAGLAIDRGVTVDETMRTSDAHVWAVGDIARFRGRFGELQRIEHWAVAQNQGRVAARNALGLVTRFTTAPFFWSQHYDLTISYVGHAESWDRQELTGDPQKLDCELKLMKGRLTLAVITLGRDRASMSAHEAMNRELGRVTRASTGAEVIDDAKQGDVFAKTSLHGLDLTVSLGKRTGEFVWLVASSQGQPRWAQRLDAGYMMPYGAKLEAEGDGLMVVVDGEHAKGGEHTSWSFYVSVEGTLWSRPY